MTEKITLEEEMMSLMKPEVSDEPEQEANTAEEDAPEAEEAVVEKPSEDVVEEASEPVVEAEQTVLPPVALSGAIKAKWKDLPPDVQAEWKKREDDIHRMMTAKDGELNLGRTIKQIASPYEAVIRAEGGTVEGAFQDLLNTAYVLRTGSPDQKAQLILSTAQQFGVDLSKYVGAAQQAQDPLANLQREIAALKQQADPNRIKSQLQEDMIRDRIGSEIQAFAANPANVHFNAVKSTMGSLIAAGKAADLQEAYEMAIWSDPSIRAELLKAQKAQEAEKKKAEMAAKKKASVSVAGSPGLASPNANTPKKTIEDELREQLQASSGKI